jgi:low temperature requirement protein LtrA
MPESLQHAVRRMAGRDPDEDGRSSTPLELLFDLTFVIAFGVAADELAHALAEQHVQEGVLAFLLGAFTVSWAWINFTWFASAYDTDDWIFRLTTMVQMVGVILVALGLPDMFASLIHHEGHLDIGLMVLGYVTMRAPMVAQWLRAGRQDPTRHALCSRMVWTLVVAQVGWALLIPLHPPMGLTAVIVVGLVGLELAGPLLAERLDGGSPWHGHHIAERYGLMVIIALGEGLLGGTAALAVLIEDGWTVEVVVLGLAGVALTFGVWWTYFVIPFGHLLAAHRERSFGWGYGHIPLFGAVVAMGAGLHAAAYFLEHKSELDATGTILAVAVPVAVYAACLYLLYAQITRTLDPFHVLLIAGTAVLLVLPVVLASAGVDMVWCLAVLALSPWVTVVGYETIGHRHNADVLARLEEEQTA